VNIEIRPLSDIRPYEKNARKIPQSAIDSVARSLKEYGWRQAIVVDKQGIIVVGHVRRLAALQLGWKEAPVHVADNLSPAQIKAYRLMDNRSHQEATWDEDLLKLELLDIRVDLDLALTGFSGRDLDAFLRGDKVGEDDVPDIPKVAVSQRGDLWTCGEHRVLCGDATSAEDVACVIGDRKPGLMVTDPPYGVSYDPAQAGKGKGPPGGKALGKVKNDECDDWREAYKLFPGFVAYVWHAALHAGTVAEGVRCAGFEIRSQIIWVKSYIAISRGHYHWQHEPCWYAVRDGATATWCGDRKQTTTWEVPKPRASETGHSTQKPVELMRRPIVNHTRRGEAVYDPFLGSGTTLIAAEITERHCLAVDIDPLYVDTAVIRWMKHTGKEAYNQDGVVFPYGNKA